MIQLEKYNQDVFTLPAVVDVINFEAHIALDIIQLKGEFFKKETHLKYNGEEFFVSKRISDKPIRTEASLQDRLSIRKVRYFCIKIKNNE